MTTLRPAPSVASITSYAPARHAAPCHLDLAGSEGRCDTAYLAPLLAAAAPAATRYPDARPLAAAIAARLDIDANRILVTAGADEALERSCRAMLAPGDDALLTAPTFEMLERYVAIAGATSIDVPWPSEQFPVDAMIATATARTRLVMIVSPNNPTGAVISFDDVQRIHDAIPQALLVLDLAYVEFADEDPTATLLALPRVLVVRTFSKAWGLAGLRVGYAAGPAPVIEWMRAAGSPYTVAATSLSAVSAALSERDAGVAGYVATVRQMRERMLTLLESLGLAPVRSQATFVCIADARARWLHDALAGFGLATRLLPAPDVDRLRISCPANDDAFAQLEHALRTALQPEAILIDLDGVLADVSQSYRRAIKQTAAEFGVSLTDRDVQRRKAAGGANDDWAVTADLIAANGTAAPLATVTQVFERLYQGDDDAPGFRSTETLVPAREWLASLAARYPLAIVTGRPATDAERFLVDAGVRDLFAMVITREAGPLKPDPFPLLAAMTALRATRAWMIGDTADDIVAARSAGALPIGVVAPGDAAETVAPVLFRAGAARVLRNIEELTACLP